MQTFSLRGFVVYETKARRIQRYNINRTFPMFWFCKQCKNLKYANNMQTLIVMALLIWCFAYVVETQIVWMSLCVLCEACAEYWIIIFIYSANVAPRWVHRETKLPVSILGSVHLEDFVSVARGWNTDVMIGLFDTFVYFSLSKSLSRKFSL